ncbi:carboxymuconolactone decarboxylase family protein [Salisaeta longa]|uniref:carboxymuconolactone decarboxylase family protein n=1 Tax=Salisaeta longa TaxID=503170 RepID=UPI0003B3AA0A|nr:carboxymuconolactone decarboxylase family protein [Salisaeta longa]
MSTTVSNAAQEVRSAAKDAMGFVPNLITEMTEHNPAVGATYLQANGAIDDGVLAGPEQQAVILAISSYNDCHYCTKAHAAAGKAAGLDAATIATINEGGLPEDERLRRLVQATRRIMGKRGWLSSNDLDELSAQDISKAEIYEIVTLLGIKTISNYVNHIAQTPVDDAFQQ